MIASGECNLEGVAECLQSILADQMLHSFQDIPVVGIQRSLSGEFVDLEFRHLYQLSIYNQGNVLFVQGRISFYGLFSFGGNEQGANLWLAGQYAGELWGVFVLVGAEVL